uniref:Large ribosomal subunit protein uL15/eL18 domain-containing protein n=1 Tax=Monodelphis domestica TaxID=13616 RepID=F6R2U6_MONDO
MPPLPLSRMIRKMKLEGTENKTAAVMGTVTDNIRIQDVPKLKVSALRVTSNARSRILKANGKILSFDQLAMTSPKGPQKCYQGYRHLGKVSGSPHSYAKPYVGSTGGKLEQGRCRRAAEPTKTNPWSCYIKDFWTVSAT